MVAIAPGIIAWHRVQQGWIDEGANFAQQLLDERAFPGQLRRVAQVLQLAAAAFAEYWARRLDPEFRRRMHLGNPDTRRAWLPAFPVPFWGDVGGLLDGNRHLFAGQTGRHGQQARLLLAIFKMYGNFGQRIAFAT